MTKESLNYLLYKWNVMAIALVAMMSIGFSSCGGDDDPVQLGLSQNLHNLVGETVGHVTGGKDVGEAAEFENVHFSAVDAFFDGFQQLLAGHLQGGFGKFAVQFFQAVVHGAAAARVAVGAGVAAADPGFHVVIFPVPAGAERSRRKQINFFHK